ncbi:UvrD-helicase domain-containing protein [Winogradskyella sp.]|uniref:UvrD-helicase domain-containing protein n=1 Tax=Winogradskyella sp. TaxID=1883156 RepID=UPI003F6A8C03
MQNSTFKIYNASAGSGKTYTLAKSYIKLLVAAKDYNAFKSILALTFTNKAVGEMKERVINMLKIFSTEDNLKKPHPMFNDICSDLSLTSNELFIKSKHVLKHIIHNYGAFNISTIDGFTHRVIRTFAHDLKLPVNFEVELDQERLLNEAVDSLIAKAGTNKDLTKILVDFAIEKTDEDKSWDISYDFNKISKLLINENDYTHIKSLKERTQADFKCLKQKIVSTISDIEEEIKSTANKTLDLITESGLEFTDFKRSTLPNHFIKASKLKVTSLYNNKLEENLAERKDLYNKTLDDYLAQTIENILPEIERNYQLQKKNIFHYKFLKAAYKNLTPLSVLNVISTELDNLKNEQNKMLISEFNQIISKEIKNQPTPFIYERLGEKYKHYFIDEFQDTSIMQWHNLVPLIENALSVSNGSAMLVGDAKQAIYRWRGGEAEQFIHLYNKYENPFQIETEVLALNTNYRSTKEIISFNNAFFNFLGENYFTDSDYAKLYKTANQNINNDSEGFVRLKFLDLQKEDDNSEVYSHEVLETINQCLQEGYNLSDICVLVRKKKEGVEIANCLSENNIDITSSETLLLFNSEKVVFIDAFLRMLTQPNNETVKVEVLSFIANQKSIDNKHAFYTTHLNKSVDKMLDSLKSVDLRINKNQLLQQPLYEMVEQLVRIFNLNNNSDAYLQFYLDVVLEFTQKQSSDLVAFVTYFEKKKDSLSIISPENLNAVQIMTIHKSKGLEFPIVIFPFADLNIYSELEPKIWYPVDQEDYCGFKDLLISYNKDVEHFGEKGQYLFNQHQSQLELDNINLLYVVLTRAISQLYIISKKDIDSKGNANRKTYAGMFIDYLQNIEIWSENKLIYAFGEKTKNTVSAKVKNMASPLPLISTPKEDHNLSIITKAGMLWDTKQEDAIERGNLVHLVLSKIKFDTDIEFALNELLITGDITNDNINELRQLVNEVINHPILSAYFKDGYKIYNERDIITSHGQLIRPDRLNFNSKKEVILIDYKTGAVKSSHKSQLNDYETILEQMNLNVIQKLLVYINDTVEVIEV